MGLVGESVRRGLSGGLRDEVVNWGRSWLVGGDRFVGW